MVAVDPSAPFVQAVRERLPGVEVAQAPAEALPFADGSFDAALAQLVVHFMRDPVAGLREMARVTRPGGVVAACVWDHAGGRTPLSVFWRAARELDPGAHDESGLAGAHEGALEELLRQAGLEDVVATELEAPFVARELRGVVGAVPARRRAGRAVRRRARRGRAGRAARALPRAASRRTGRRRLGGPRRRRLAHQTGIIASG